MRVFLLAALLFPAFAYAGPDTGKATPQEIHDKVLEAATYLSKAGKDGLAEFSKSKGKFVWKDSRVWVTECDGIYCYNSPLLLFFMRLKIYL